MLRYLFSFRRNFKLFGWAVCSLFLLGSMTDFGCSTSYVQQTSYDVNAARPEIVPPGTVVDRKPPEGWSHLIIKTQPFPAAGDLDALPEIGRKLASMLVTMQLANVKAEKVNGELEYYIERIAVGVGMNVNGQDVILTPDTQKRLGADLGFFGRMVLSQAYQRQFDCRIVARSRTMIVMDVPGFFLRGNDHVEGKLRYVLLLNEKTGYLAPLLWSIDLDARGGHAAAVGPIQWLAPNTVDSCKLHVDRRHFALGIPKEAAFAMLQVPQGQMQIPIPDEIQQVATQERLSAEQARQLEWGLRTALLNAVQKK